MVVMLVAVAVAVTMMMNGQRHPHISINVCECVCVVLVRARYVNVWWIHHGSINQPWSDLYRSIAYQTGVSLASSQHHGP